MPLGSSAAALALCIEWSAVEQEAEQTLITRTQSRLVPLDHAAAIVLHAQLPSSHSLSKFEQLCREACESLDNATEAEQENSVKFHEARLFLNVLTFSSSATVL